MHIFRLIVAIYTAMVVIQGNNMCLFIKLCMFFFFDWLCAGTSFCQQDCGFGSMFCTNPQSPVPLSHLHGPPGGEAWELLLQLGKFLDKTLKTQSPYCLQVMKSITIVTVCMKYNHFFQALSTLSTPAYIHIYIYI